MNNWISMRWFRCRPLLSEKQQEEEGELEHSVSEQRERTRKMTKQMAKKITHRMESTGMFCTSCRIHLYSCLRFGGKSEKRSVCAEYRWIRTSNKFFLRCRLVKGVCLTPWVHDSPPPGSHCPDMGPQFQARTFRYWQTYRERVSWEEVAWEACHVSGDQKIPFPPIQDWVSKKRLWNRRTVSNPSQNELKKESGISFQYPLIKWGLIWKAISCGLLATKPTPDVAAERCFQ